MKFSNQKYVSVYKNTYLVLFVCVISFLLIKYLLGVTIPAYYSLGISVFLFIVFIFWYQKARYFEYDSTGLGLVLISRGVLVSDYTNYRERRIEIPKDKLYKFKIKNYIFSKKLYIYIKSTKGIKKTRIDITLLSSRRRKDLKASLNKVVEQNLAK